MTCDMCQFCYRYDASDDLLSDIDCQRQAICEVYKNSAELGEISKRAKHSLDSLESLSQVSLPDSFMNVIDEFHVSNTDM